MTRITKLIPIAGLSAVIGCTAMVTSADARDGESREARKHYGGGEQSRRHLGNSRRETYHDRHRDLSVGRGLRGVIILGEGDGGCAYEYRRWQATGSRYWRSRYRDCRSG